MTSLDSTAGVGYAASPFADAVLTPSFSVTNTGASGDRAAPREGATLAFSSRARPVIEIGRRRPMLIGRQEELEDLSDRIRRGESVEVLAKSGFGKTSLANLVVHDRSDLKSYFVDGVVSLSGRSTSRSDLIGVLFRTFFESDSKIVFDDAEMLRQLSPLRALMILDGFDIDGSELEEIISSLSTPVFVITSSGRRLHDFASTSVGPLLDLDLIAAAELRLGTTLDDDDRDAVLELSALVDRSPRAWARAIDQLEDKSGLRDTLVRLRGARDPIVETVRSSIDRTSPLALEAATILAELSGAALGADLLGALVGETDETSMVDDLEAHGLATEVDGFVAVDTEVAAVVHDRLDADRLSESIFERANEWVADATPQAVALEAAGLTALAEWGVGHGQADNVIELGKRLDESLFKEGHWGATSAILPVVARAGEQCDQPADTAWALHQMGVRELALGDNDAAKSHLRKARSIRHRIGDKQGAALSHEHLRLLGPLAAIAAPFVIKLLFGFLLGVGAIGVGATIFWPDSNDDGGTSSATTAPPADRDETTTTTTTAVPSTFIGLAAALEGEISVRVTVTLPNELSDGETLQVSRISPDGTETTLPDTMGGTTFLDRGLAAESTYRYRARVIGGGDGDPGPWSDEIEVKTGRQAEAEPPPPPTDVTSDYRSSSGSVLVSWEASTASDVAGYDVWRDGTVVTPGITELSYEDTSPIAGRTHEYVVRAFDDARNVSLPSNVARAEVPGEPPARLPAPTGLKAVFVEGVGVTFSWEGSASEFEVNRNGWAEPRTTSVVQIIDPDVAVGDELTYTVRSIGRGKRPSQKVEFPYLVEPQDPGIPPTPGRPSIEVLGGRRPSGLAFRYRYVSVSGHISSSPQR